MMSSADAARILGDMKASVVEKVVVEGSKDPILELERNKGLYDQGGGYIYHGKVVYNIQSEPNSLVTVHYQSVDNNYILKKLGNSAKNLVKTTFEYSTRTMNFDNKGNGNLIVNPSFFIEDEEQTSHDNDEKRKSIYYVTLFY